MEQRSLTYDTSPLPYKPTLVDRMFPVFIAAGVVAFIWIVLFARSSSIPAPAAFSSGFVILSLGVLLCGGLLYPETRRAYLLTAPESFGYGVYTPWLGDVVSIIDRSSATITEKRLSKRAWPCCRSVPPAITACCSRCGAISNMQQGIDRSRGIGRDGERFPRAR